MNTYWGGGRSFEKGKAIPHNLHIMFALYINRLKNPKNIPNGQYEFVCNNLSN